MAHDQYGIVIEDMIANAHNYTLNSTQVYCLVRDQSCQTVSKTTIKRWLTKLIDEEIINRDDRPRKRNEVYYSLTPARMFERQLFGPSSKSKSAHKPLSENEGEEQPLKKACLLILLQSALGTVIPKSTDSPVLGAVYGYNPDTGRNECLTGEKLPGVTMREILDHANIGLGGLFNHVNFNRLLRENDCVEMIQKVLGLDNNTAVVRRLVRKNNGQIGIEIVDRQLRDFITLCACMVTWIHLRLSDTIALAMFNALYRNRGVMELPRVCSFSIFEQDVLVSYLSLYGRREVNREFERCKEIFAKLTSRDNVAIGEGNRNNKQLSKSTGKKKVREHIQHKKDQILRWDKNIIASYHGLIKCDRYVDAPGALGERDKYGKYRQYVRREMPQKYHHLTDILIKLVYPSFLQRYHRTNPKLIEFTKSLPYIAD